VATSVSKDPAASIFTIKWNSPTLKMEAAGYSKAFVPIYQTTWHDMWTIIMKEQVPATDYPVLYYKFT
jgi:hypothetical protein